MTFLIVLSMLKRYAFGPIQAMLDAGAAPRSRPTSTPPSRRARRPRRRWPSTAPRWPSRARRRCGSSRSARRTSEEQRREALAELEAEKTRQVERARAEIDSERRRSLQEIKATLADLTVAATEKVVRKQLDAAEQKRLIDEALADVDLSAFSTAQAEGDG